MHIYNGTKVLPITGGPSMLHQNSLTPIFQFCHVRMKSLHSGYVFFKEKGTNRCTTQSSVPPIGGLSIILSGGLVALSVLESPAASSSGV